MRDFHHLDVWRKAHAFALDVYRITERFPKSETFESGDGLRSARANLIMKIAEGCGRDVASEYIACLAQARGMGMEVEYQLLLARDLHFITGPDYDVLQHQVIEVRQMLSGVMKFQV